MICTPFIKQLYAALPPLLASFSMGGALCYPMVLLQQLKPNNTVIQIDFETASWIGSIHGLAGIPTVFVLILMQIIGRKFAFILASVITTTGWLLAYLATNSTTILVSEAFHGFGTSSLLAISTLTLTELISPKYRDAFIQIFFIVYALGTISIGVLAQCFSWRTISMIMFVPMLISVIIACTTPESPYWLAYKGNFNKCKKNFIWLRGTDVDSHKELNDMIKEHDTKGADTEKNKSKFSCKTIFRKDFYMPAVHMCVLQLLIQGSGTIVTLIYSIEMLKKTIHDDDVSSHGGLIMNSLFCVGILISFILDRYFLVKPVLLWSVFGVSLSMIIGSIFSYLQEIGLWPKKSLAGLICLSAFMLSTSIGIICTAFSLASALMPVKHRGIGGALMIFNTNFYHAIFLKSAPYMFLHLNMWGSYLVYAAVSLCCGFIIWKYVPEIKGRSLQEIANYYCYGSYSAHHDQVIDSQETAVLKEYQYQHSI